MFYTDKHRIKRSENNESGNLPILEEPTVQSYHLLLECSMIQSDRSYLLSILKNSALTIRWNVLWRLTAKCLAVTNAVAVTHCATFMRVWIGKEVVTKKYYRRRGEGKLVLVLWLRCTTCAIMRWKLFCADFWRLCTIRSYVFFYRLQHVTSLFVLFRS